MREQYCQTSERAETDYMFPPKDEPTLLYELERVQDSLDSSDRPRPLVNYSSTDESESELSQSNAYTSDEEDDDHQSGQMAQKTLQSK